ncbi:MAG: BON domain-containing protein [Terriglobales bacterium]
MKHLVCATLVLFAASMLAQQAPPSPGPPPGSTPPAFPQGGGEQPPVTPMPPDTKAPAPHELSNIDVQKQVQHKLATEPLLQDAEVIVAVDDKSLILSGTADNEQQHRLALRIAQSYAGEREIVDKITVPDGRG